jgi:hypothetical protein
MRPTCMLPHAQPATRTAAVQILQLSSNIIGPDGVKALAPYLRCMAGLRELNLGCAAATTSSLQNDVDPPGGMHARLCG